MENVLIVWFPWWHFVGSVVEKGRAGYAEYVILGLQSLCHGANNWVIEIITAKGVVVQDCILILYYRDTNVFDSHSCVSLLICIPPTPVHDTALSNHNFNIAVSQHIMCAVLHKTLGSTDLLGWSNLFLKILKWYFGCVWIIPYWTV